MNHRSTTIRTWMMAAWLLALALLAGLPGVSRAALTSIANEPLPTLVGGGTKPNILFILDNSGSMGWDYMPDDVKNAALSYTTTYGYKSAQCNGVAYDPTYTYKPPIKADGTYYPAASFSGANPNGYGPTLVNGTAYYSDSTVTTGTGSKVFVFKSGFLAGLFNGFNFLGGLPPWSVGDTLTGIDADDDNHWVIGTVTSVVDAGFCLFSCTRTVTINVTSYNGTDSASDWKVNQVQVDNLNNSTYYVYGLPGTQTKMGWTYTAAGVDNSVFKNECISHPGLPTGEAGDGKFTGVVVTSGSAEAQNYANWYQYYRTRMLMMRSAAGLAFQPLTSQYRVGFTTINDTGITESSTMSVVSSGKAFLNVRDYDSTQRDLFMQRLYNSTPSGGTPLRSALSKAGQYFAKKVSGQTYDPTQYSCQRNYAFLSTDGYWNDASSPKQLDNTTNIGQQDAADVRPYTDGGAATSSTVTTVTDHNETDTPVTVTQKYTYTGYTYTTGTCFSPASGCSCFTPTKRTNTALSITPSSSGTRVQLSDSVTKTTVAVSTNAGAQTSSSSVAGPTTTIISTTDPTPTAPALAAWPMTAGYTSAVTTTCVAASGSPPASDGGPFPSGAATVNTTGTPTTTTLSTEIAGPTTTVVGGSGGTANTLADVAQYYYKNDLRTSALGNCTGALGTDVCDNALMTPTDDDPATWQHMSSFTLGLGVNGVLPYDRNYLANAADPNSTYYKLISGAVGWPAPIGDTVTTVDDLWHAAVNGRGQYFGAKNATDLTVGLKGAIASMDAKTYSGSAPAPSDPKPTSASLSFAGKYLSKKWSGDLLAYTVDATGVVSDTPIPGSSAQSGVDNLALRSLGDTDTRVIYYRKPGTSLMRAFTYTNLSSDSLGASFTNFCSTTVSDTATVYPLQCTGMSAPNILLANDGSKLVDWLRGVFTYEDTNSASPLFRSRLHVLGDIVSSTPAYMAAPPYSYTDSGYSAFRTTWKDRKAVVYVGANDGMLHAFSGAPGTLGKELWAFVPTAMMPTMGRLANTDYGNRHQYYVDGSPVVGEISVGGTWKTILVGGFNAGGKGYYALDITNPDSPTVLWEFTQAAVASATATNAKDPDLGYSFGNPIIAKRADGTWVVAFGSGYNNTGNGYLYVVNANTGVAVSKIATGAGSAATPSGLGPINAWIDDPNNKTAKRFYGGDLMGNLWRFDIDNLVAPNGAAQRLASFMVGGSTPQSITVMPELSYVSYLGVKYPVVFVGTGRYLGSADLTDTTVQSIYAIKDRLTATDWGDVRANGAVIQQTITTSGKTRTASSNAVNWSLTTVAGWRLDLPDSKERIRINMQAHFGVLYADSTVPGISTCSVAGGTGWSYIIDQATGSKLSGATTIGSYLESATSGMTYVLVNGQPVLVKNNDKGNTTTNKGGPKPPPSGAGTFKRASWRELINN